MPSADVFRPRLPLDPFAQSHVPWQLNLSTGLKPAASQVILILGEPQPKDLLALLTSSYLTRTLILLATHTPPVLPHLPLTTPGPALRILRLSQPLSVHDAGALRLVSVLEKANNAAERWRKETGGPAKPGMRERVVMFREDGRSGEFVVQEEYVYAAASASGAWTGLAAASTSSASGARSGTPMRYPSPAPSLHASSPLASSTHTPDSSRDVSPFASPAHSVSSRTSLALFTASSSAPNTSTTPSTPNATRRSRLSSLASTSSNSKSPQTHHLKSTAPSTRVFDAIINFLPTGVQDKALLKHAILVTTLGARYLDPDPSSSSSFGLSTPASNPSSFPSSSSLSASSSHRPYSTLSAFSASTFSPGSTSRPVSTSLSPPNATASKKRFSLFSFGSSVDLSNAHGTVEGEVEEDFALLAQRRGKERESRGSFVGGGSVRQRLSMFLGVGSSSSSINGDSGTTHERRQRLDHTQSQQVERKVAPHIVHVLPHGWSDPSSSHSHSSSHSANPRLRQQREQEKPKLVQGIEQFLLSFAYPLGGLGMSDSGSGSGGSSGGRPPSHYSTHSSRAREAINATAPRPPPSAFHPSHSFSNANSHATFSQSGSLSRGGMSASAPAISALAGTPTTNGGGGGVLGQLQARAVPYVVGSGVFGALIGSSSFSSSSSPSSGPSSMRVHRRRGSAESSLSTASAEDTTTTTAANVDGPHGREGEEKLTHGEAILLGLLDYDPSSGSAGGSGRAWVRGGDVWIEGVGEEVVGSGSQSRSPSRSPTLPPTLPPIPMSVQLGSETTTTEKVDKGKGKSKSEAKRPQLPTPPESGSGSSSSSESGSSRSSSVEVEDVAVERADGTAHNAQGQGAKEGVVFTLTEPTPLGGRFVVPRPSSSKLVKGPAQRPAGAFPRRSASESSGGSPTEDDDEERIKGLPTKPRMIHLSDAHYQRRAPLSASPASVSVSGAAGGGGMGGGSKLGAGALLGGDLAALGATHGEKARSTSALEMGSRSMEVGVSINGVSSGSGERRKEKRGYGITSAFRKIGFGIWKKEAVGVKVR